MSRRTLTTAEWSGLVRLTRLHDAAQTGIRADEFAADAGVTPDTAKSYLCALARTGLAETVSRAPTSWVPLYTPDGLPIAQAERQAAPAEPGEAARHLADAERLIEDAIAGAAVGYRLENRLRTAVLPLLRLAREALQS